MATGNKSQGSESDKVFLFPLTRVVLFPFTTKPLNIFEPRYLQMMSDAIERDIPVALAYADPSPSAQAIGTSPKSGALAHIRQVAGAGKVQLLERRDDGTLLVLVECIGKARLKSVVAASDPYTTVAVDWIKEDNSLASENIFLLNRLVKELAKWLEENVPDGKQRDTFLRQLQTPEERINYYCSLVLEDTELQQKLLETDSLSEKLRALSLTMETYSV